MIPSFHQAHNGYELEKVFGIQASLLSHHFDADIWQELILKKQRGVSIAQSFADLGFPIEMIAETTNYKTHNPFNGKVYQIPSNEFHQVSRRIRLLPRLLDPS